MNKNSNTLFGSKQNNTVVKNIVEAEPMMFGVPTESNKVGVKFAVHKDGNTIATGAEGQLVFNVLENNTGVIYLGDEVVSSKILNVTAAQKGGGAKEGIKTITVSYVGAGNTVSSQTFEVVDAAAVESYITDFKTNVFDPYKAATDASIARIDASVNNLEDWAKAVNITSDENALDEFLSVYDGASTGEMKDLLQLKAESLKRMDAQKVDLPIDLRNRVCQYFETAIRETTRSLMKSGEKPLDLNCTETQSIYANQEGDEFMRGFISLRTLGYLVRNTIATYFNFGKSGIQSANFKKMIEGLCGLALSRKNGEVVKTKVAENYYQSLVQTLSSIDKLSNSKIKVYEEFFNKIISNTKTELSQEEVTSILNKFSEMSNDTEVKDVSKPLEDIVVTKLCDLIKHNSKKILTIRIKPDEDLSNTLTTETCTGMISRWNYMSEMYSKVSSIVRDPKNTYTPDVTKAVDSAKEKLTEDYMKLSSYSKLTATNFPEFKTLMPEIKKIG